MLALNILSMSSLVVFEKAESHSFTQFEFLRRLLEFFGGDMNSLKSSVTIPPLVLFSHAGHISSKDSKKTMELYLAPESGFSEEIGERNMIRNLITTVFESREAIGAATPRGTSVSDLFGTDELRSRYRTVYVIFLITIKSMFCSSDWRMSLLWISEACP
jgi:hypothetical protein